MINLVLSLSHYQEKPAILPSGLRSYRHTARFKPPAPVGLFGDLELMASLSPEIDKKELARLDEDRKAGAYLKAKLKGVPLSAFHQRILNLLVEEDAAYHTRKKEDSVTAVIPKGIDLNNGTWRVRKQVNGEKFTRYFPTLEQAKEFNSKSW
jgi:hypothetical protein